MDWVLTRQATIENAFAASHLSSRCSTDVSSAAFMGRCLLGAMGTAAPGFVAGL
jgi:hypothetical protein